MREAWELATGLLAEHGEDDWNYVNIAFNAAGNLSEQLRTFHQFDEAEDVCRQTLAGLEQLVRDRPDDRRLVRLLGELQAENGHALRGAGKLQEAEMAFRSALISLQNSLGFGESPYRLLQAAAPIKVGETQIGEDLANQAQAIRHHALAQSALGCVLHQLGEYDNAAMTVNEAAFVTEQLVNRYPDRNTYRLDLARARWAQSAVLSEDPSQSEQYLRQAEEVYGQLVDSEPENPYYRHDLAQVLGKLAELLDEEGQHEAANDAFAAGMEQAEKAYELAPNLPDLVETLNSLRAQGSVPDFPTPLY